MFQNNLWRIMGFPMEWNHGMMWLPAPITAALGGGGCATSNNIVTGCNCVISSVQRTISYKPGNLAGSRERCNWMLKTSKATDYDVKLLQIGSPSNSSDVLVAFSFSGHSEAQRHLNTSGDFTLHGSIIVLTFFTDDNSSFPSRGLALSFRARLSGTEPTTFPGSESQLIPESGEVTVDYPKTQGTNYGNNELALILQSPDDNRLPEFYSVTFNYTKFEAKSCVDCLTVWAFVPHASVEQPWFQHAKLCGWEAPGVMFVNRDVFLLVFRSDSSETGLGFRVTFNDRVAIPGTSPHGASVGGGGGTDGGGLIIGTSGGGPDGNTKIAKDKNT